MDRMQATRRKYPMVGGLADLLAAGTSPQRTQQMRGLMEFLQVPDIAQTLDRVSYGEPLTTGRGMTTKLRPEAENTLMAALGMIPAGRPAEAGAMALGRAGERMAERVVPQVMERGGLPAEMLSAMAQGTQSPATVFHGSPHRFTKFDSSKIGTGEGAQAFGHGLYLAEAPGVATEYAKILQKPTNSLFAEESLEKINPQLLQKLREATGNDKYSSNAGKAYMRPSDFNLSPELKKEVLAFKKNSSNLYQVDLPDEQIAKMLDYDKPLSKQPPAVQAWLSSPYNAYRNQLTAKDVGGNEPTGAMILGKLQELMSEGKRNDVFTNAANFGAANASRELAEAGIPGIRYLDQGSRGTSGGEIIGVVKEGDSWRARVRVDNRTGVGFSSPTQMVTKSKPYKTQEEAQKWAEQVTGKGTSNFVVFPGMEDMLRIEQINEQPINSLLQTLGR